MDQENPPSDPLPAHLDDLQHSVDLGALALDLDSQTGKEKHLDGGAGRVPEGACTSNARVNGGRVWG